jgi:capsule polysaccharide export protein KpsE/RkpR
MTIELTNEERKALLTAIETHFSNVPDDRSQEEIETDRTLKILRVRLTAFDPDATQKIKALLAKGRGKD